MDDKGMFRQAGESFGINIHIYITYVRRTHNMCRSPSKMMSRLSYFAKSYFVKCQGSRMLRAQEFPVSIVSVLKYIFMHVHAF